MRTVAGPFLARLVTLPISIVCGLLNVSLLVGSLGTNDYGLVSLLVTLQLLLPFLDLGTGAAVLNAAAAFRESGRESGTVKVFSAVLRRAVWVTSSASLGLTIAVIAVGVGGLWPDILGVSGDGRVTAAIVAIVCVNLISRPLVLSSTALIGLGNGTMVVALQALVPVVSLAVVAIGSVVDAPLAGFAVNLVVGQMAAGLVAALILHRRVPGLTYSLFCRKDRSSGIPFFRTAAPMLAISFLGPFATSLDRILLSHLSNPVELAVYALCAQLYQPLLSLITSIQQPLWADFARRREVECGGTLAWFRKVSISMSLLGICLGGGMALVAAWIGQWVSHDAIRLEQPIVIAFSVVVVLAAAQCPSGSLLTTGTGLRLQAGVISCGVVVNLGVTGFTVESLGAVGAVLGTAFGGAIILIGTFLLAQRQSVRLDDSLLGRNR